MLPTMPLDVEKLRELREERGLSMQEAAVAAGFASRQQWYAIESGRKTNVELETLERIAAALGVHAKELLK